MVYQTSGGAQWPILAGSIDTSLLPAVAYWETDADGWTYPSRESGLPAVEDADGWVILGAASVPEGGASLRTILIPGEPAETVNVY